jgi:hypothetical protein
MDSLAAAFLRLVRSLRHNFGTLRYLVATVNKPHEGGNYF